VANSRCQAVTYAVVLDLGAKPGPVRPCERVIRALCFSSARPRDRLQLLVSPPFGDERVLDEAVSDVYGRPWLTAAVRSPSQMNRRPLRHPIREQQQRPADSSGMQTDSVSLASSRTGTQSECRLNHVVCFGVF